MLPTSKDEMRTNPCQADKNGDGKLTIQELDQGLRSILPPGKGPSSKDVVSCVTDNNVLVIELGHRICRPFVVEDE
ncbi:hypothetical protein MAR_007121 [Mya arenaria]|uniref:EF-hand domain-containing protein n=1 Tax=Mya arenaria TaxID=6604 RepID=A0ABY7DD54_MYAAR|nr:hypothetical protein MAR_007121 [Mya arenaria]